MFTIKSYLFTEMRNPAGKVFQRPEIWEETLKILQEEGVHVSRYIKKVIRNRCIDLFDNFVFNTRRTNLTFNGKKYESYNDLKAFYTELRNIFCVITIKLLF